MYKLVDRLLFRLDSFQKKGDAENQETIKFEDKQLTSLSDEQYLRYRWSYKLPKVSKLSYRLHYILYTPLYEVPGTYML